MICKNAGYPECGQKSHSSEQCNEFGSSKTKKDLDRRLTKHDNNFNQCHETGNKGTNI